MNRPVEVWVVPLDGPAPPPDHLVGLLDDAERARYDAFRDPALQRRYLRSHAAARAVLGTVAGVAPHRIRVGIGSHGKPEPAGLPGLAYSLSHADELAVVAVSTTGTLGVDVDRVRDGSRWRALATRWFPPDEARQVLRGPRRDDETRFLRLWTRKEAVVKAAGARLADGLRLPVGCADGPRLVEASAGSLRGQWVIHDVPVARPYAASVAVEGMASPGFVGRSFRWSACTG